MEEFIQMAENYRAEAARLYEYRRRLASEIKTERDPDRLHILEEKKAVAEAERYEIIDDLRHIRDYISERKKHGG